MSLATNVNDLAIRVATEAKSLRTLINGNAADNSALITTAKANLVAAINELQTELDDLAAGAAGIDDSVVSASTTWSSQKTSGEISSAVAAVPAPSSIISDTAPAANKVYSSNKTEAVVSAAVAGIHLTDLIDDATPSGTKVYSSSKTDAVITAAVNALIDAAPGTLDTLNELAAALGNDSNFAATVNAALGNRVRVDTATQGLNATQQGNARTNIGAAAASDLTTLTNNVGNTAQNFVATFEGGLA